MKFKKGHDPRRARGGKRPGAGRPTKIQAEAKRIAQEANRLAQELAKKYLEDWLRVILDTYVSLATGQKVGKIRRKLDPATTRHCVERFVPPATKRIILEDQHTAEDFYEKVMKGEYEADGEPKQIEDKTKKDDDEPPDPSKMH